MSSTELGIIVQARMGSTRLPGKVLMEVGDRPLLQHIIDRSQKIKSPHKLVIATTNLKKDDPIADFCMERKIEVFRGDESNVLYRYYRCAQKFNFKHIVRLTADNPYFDYEELDYLFRCYMKAHIAYANNFEFLPIGVGMEIMTFAALEKSHNDGHAPHHLEHVNEYILENPQIFNSMKFAPVKKEKIDPKLRMTIDTSEDLARANFVFKKAHGEVTTEKIVKILHEQSDTK